jgi:dTDP-4-dehydrorhamnose 3,5-epimerase
VRDHPRDRGKGRRRAREVRGEGGGALSTPAHSLAGRRRARPSTEKLAISGVELLDLPTERDARGSLVELCRNSWVAPDEPVQWNAVTNRSGSLRGVHWHNRHADYLAAVHGRVLVAAVDLRRGSPSEREALVVELGVDAPRAVFIPAGVGHGFYSAADSVLMYGVSAYWDPDDELGVRWDDPALGIPWPPETARHAIVSERDSGFPPLAEAPPRPRWVDVAG